MSCIKPLDGHRKLCRRHYFQQDSFSLLALYSFSLALLCSAYARHHPLLCRSVLVSLAAPFSAWTGRLPLLSLAIRWTLSFTASSCADESCCSFWRLAVLQLACLGAFAGIALVPLLACCKLHVLQHPAATAALHVQRRNSCQLAAGLAVCGWLN